MPRRKQTRRAHGEGSIDRRRDKAGKVIGYRGGTFVGQEYRWAVWIVRC